MKTAVILMDKESGNIVGVFDNHDTAMIAMNTITEVIEVPFPIDIHEVNVFSAEDKDEFNPIFSKLYKGLSDTKKHKLN